MGAFDRFGSLLCFQLKGEKSQVGHAIVFSASLGTSPERLTGGNY